MRADQQPDGGRRYRRDRPCPALAVGQVRLEDGELVKQCTKSSNDPQDSGKKIDAAYLQPIFSEEAAKVSAQPGYEAANIKIASEYLIGDIKSQWPADFLTSDLSKYLDADRAATGNKSSL